MFDILSYARYAGVYKVIKSKCMYMGPYIRICMYVCMYLWLGMYMCVHMYVHICMYHYVYMYMYIRAYIICVHNMCMYAHA